MTKSNNKFGAIKTEVDGFTFDSKAEATRYRELKLQALAGEITTLQVHPIYPLEINEVYICDCELDFVYKRNVEWIYEDVKGKDTDISKLKRKMTEAYWGIKIDLIRKRR